MLIKDIHFELKDGRKAVIRNPKDEDIEGMLHYLYASSEETEFILRYPEECTKYTPENEKKLFAQKNGAEHEAMLICLVEEKIAGSCDISVYTGMKTKHRASVAIALLREYWNQGIGTRLFQEMIRIAESFEEVIQMELEFIEGNTRAQHLYEKMGFRITGVRPNAIRLKDGSLLNEYMMIKELKNTRHISIIPAYDHPQETATLFSEYTDMLIAGDSSFQKYLAIQHYGEEIRHLEEKYGIPCGRLYLAYCGEEPAGCIGLRKIDDENCEMKRLYVRPQFRGQQIGNQLIQKIIADAKEIGYSHMLLDTLPFLKSAIHMYRKYGFYEIESYNDSPMDNSIFMKLNL